VRCFGPPWKFLQSNFGFTRQTEHDPDRLNFPEVESHPMKLSDLTLRIRAAYELLIKVASSLQSPLLLVLRLYWGWQFFGTGKGKLSDLDKVAGFFGTLNIPFPYFNALLAGATECFGGLLLLVGLASRLVSVPLAFTMVIAYLTAEQEALHAIFSDPDKFTEATPFLFLLTCVVILVFGPGKLSIDYLLERKLGLTSKPVPQSI
jgi:putative oxidoreductase